MAKLTFASPGARPTLDVIPVELDPGGIPRLAGAGRDGTPP